MYAPWEERLNRENMEDREIESRVRMDEYLEFR